MSVKLGTLDISAFKVGSADCKVYLGETLIYSGDTPTPPTPTPSYSGQYLTFVATESGTFKLSGNSINYSLDSGNTWTELASDTDSPTVTSGSKILWKASGLTPTSSIGIGRFSSTASFTVEGNAMSLLYGDNFSGVTDLTGYDDAFKNLFSGCTTLTSAENLSLPATTLAIECYYFMFRNCTSLTTAPSLPATTLAEKCYYLMFMNCTSLTTAPELSATTLADGCYNSMFYNCTSLTTAPKLLATTLADYCYTSMFKGCTSLSSITCLATDISALNCTSGWVRNVSPNGTFTKAASMTSWTSGNDGIPSGWSVQDAT